jgi:hypothetical protein
MDNEVPDHLEVHLVCDLQRSDHRSVQALEAHMRAWINDWNEHPKPFIRAKTADEILDKLGRLPLRTTSSTT